MLICCVELESAKSPTSLDFLIFSSVPPKSLSHLAAIYFSRPESGSSCSSPSGNLRSFTLLPKGSEIPKSLLRNSAHGRHCAAPSCAQPKVYPYCEKWALSWNWRKHLIIKAGAFDVPVWVGGFRGQKVWDFQV